MPPTAHDGKLTYTPAIAIISLTRNLLPTPSAMLSPPTPTPATDPIEALDREVISAILAWGNPVPLNALRATLAMLLQRPPHHPPNCEWRVSRLGLQLGLGSHRNTVLRACNWLEDRRVIARDQAGRIWFNPLVQTWLPAIADRPPPPTNPTIPAPPLVALQAPVTTTPPTLSPEAAKRPPTARRRLRRRVRRRPSSRRQTRPDLPPQPSP